MQNAQFELKNAGYRKSVDLRLFAAIINAAVQEVFPGYTADIYVNYFEIAGFPASRMTRGKARALGRSIASNQAFQPYITRYTNCSGETISSQLFQSR